RAVEGRREHFAGQAAGERLGNRSRLCGRLRSGGGGQLSEDHVRDGGGPARGAGVLAGRGGRAGLRRGGAAWRSGRAGAGGGGGRWAEGGGAPGCASPRGSRPGGRRGPLPPPAAGRRRLTRCATRPAGAAARSDTGAAVAARTATTPQRTGAER